jgi:predicted esterase
MNKGIVMNAWFDVPPMGPEMFSKVDQKGFVSSMAYVFSIIKDEVASGTPMQRIIIGGFSQGGCLGIHTVLKCPYVRPLRSPPPLPRSACRSYTPSSRALLSRRRWRGCCC